MRRSETRKPRPMWALLGAVLIPAALVVLFELAKSRPALLAAWVAGGMAPLEQMLGRLWGRFPFSVGEKPKRRFGEVFLQNERCSVYYASGSLLYSRGGVARLPARQDASGLPDCQSSHGRYPEPHSSV